MKDPEFDQHIKAFDPILVSMPLSEAYKGNKYQRSALRTLTATLIGRYVSNTKLVKESGAVKLQVPLGHKLEVKMLKQLTWHYVIDNPSLASQQYGQRRVIRELFKIFRGVAQREESWNVLPMSSREHVETAFAEITSTRERERALTRIVVDAIAGMTEKHAVEMHRRLTGSSLGSALDQVSRY